jgi:hypothetical protein
MKNKNVLLVALAVGFILLLVWLAMQITAEVNWDLADFVLAGALLFGTGLAYVLVASKADTIAYRAAVSLALAGALLLVWINLAVGIIGSEDNPANWLYIGVLAVLIIGSLIARFRPQGMARALFATALAQALVTIIALIAENYLAAFEILMLNGFFVALWVGSALLFRRANATLNLQPE